MKKLITTQQNAKHSAHKNIVLIDLDEEMRKIREKREYNKNVIVYIISYFTIVILFGFMFMITLYNTYLTRFNSTALILNCISIFIISSIYIDMMINEDERFRIMKMKTFSRS